MCWKCHRSSPPKYACAWPICQNSPVASAPRTINGRSKSKKFLRRNQLMSNNSTPANLDILMDVPVGLTVELGSCQLPMRDVLQLNVGSVVQLDKVADAPVEMHVN